MAEVQHGCAGRADHLDPRSDRIPDSDTGTHSDSDTGADRGSADPRSDRNSDSCADGNSDPRSDRNSGSCAND